MNNIKLWQIIGAVFTLISGTLLHFVYGWFGGNLWAILGSVNESVWEHQKLVFWPMTFFMVAEFIFYGRKKEGFISIKVNSILLAMFINICLFYLYSGILGTHIFIVDILLYIIAIVVAYRFAYKNLRWTSEFYMIDFISACELGVLLGICVLIVIFTFDPPQIGIFMVE
jgi:hypothetical protein